MIGVDELDGLCKMANIGYPRHQRTPSGIYVEWVDAVDYVAALKCVVKHDSHIQHMREMSNTQLMMYRGWIQELIEAGSRLARMESRDQFDAQCAWDRLLKRGMRA